MVERTEVTDLVDFRKEQLSKIFSLSAAAEKKKSALVQMRLQFTFNTIGHTSKPGLSNKKQWAIFLIQLPLRKVMMQSLIIQVLSSTSPMSTRWTR